MVSICCAGGLPIACSCVPLIIIAADSSRDLASSPFAAGAQPAAPMQDYTKLFAAEKDSLELADGLYSWVGADVEIRVLKKFGKL